MSIDAMSPRGAAWCCGSHAIVVMSHTDIPRPAPAASHAIVRSHSSASAATTRVRSEPDDTVAVQMQVGELAVRVLQVELHRAAGRPAAGAADLGDGVLEA